MNLTRFFALVFLALPFFAFAQTTLTEAQVRELLQQASQTAPPSVQTPNILEQRAAAQLQIDALLADFLKTFPTKKELQKRTLVDNVTIQTTPEYPDPNETIKAVAFGFLSDFDTATISWSINGKVVERGVGKKTFSFQNGDSGKTTTLAMNVITNSGVSIKKEVSFTPLGTTILWEADTYTPPFYKGKPLLSSEAQVRAIAVPDGGNASNFIYKWEKNGEFLASASGYGKDSFVFKGPKPFGETGVRVNISSLNKTLGSKKSVNLPVSQPFILFYESHPLIGTWYNRPVATNLNITKKEFSIIAEPYFFSNENSEKPTLAYKWSLNGRVAHNPGRKITIKNESGGKSVSSLALRMRGLTQTFQSASRSLTINFAADESARPTF